MFAIGHVKIDLETKSRRLDEDYRLATANGVHSLLLAWYEVREEAIRSGNYDAIDVLADVVAAMNDAHLSERERDACDLVRRWDIAEVAGIMNIDETTAMTHLAKGCEKIARYLGESEGYR